MQEKRIPVVVAGLDGISGVTAWSSRLKQAFRDHPKYEVVLTNTRHTGNKIGVFDHMTPSKDSFRRLLLDLGEAIVIPNFIWPIFDVCSDLVAGGQNLRCLGFCRADSEEEYYLPLEWYEPIISTFIAVSPECQSKLSARIPHRRQDIALLPTCVYVPDTLDRSYSAKPIRLVYGGRVVQTQKRVMDFIPLVRGLLAREVDFFFDIVGQGRQLGELQAEMARLPHGGRVRFSGKITPEEMLRVWSGHDVFIQTSEFEGTSNSMLESMALGTVPVVTKTESGVSQVLINGENGMTVPIGDMDAMVDSIIELSADSRRLERMGRAAHESVRPFSVEAYSASFSALLDRTWESKTRTWPVGRVAGRSPEFAGLDLPDTDPEPKTIVSRVKNKIIRKKDFNQPPKKLQPPPLAQVDSEIPNSFNKDSTVVLAAAADEQFVLPLAVMVKSVLVNLDPDKLLLLYVIDGGITESSKRKLLESWGTERVFVKWVKPQLSLLRDLKISGHVNTLTYCRLLIPYLLPESHEKAIYLDSDVVVLADISQLWDVDLGGHFLLAAQDMTAPFMDSELALSNFDTCAPYLSATKALENYRELDIAPDKKYFNAGLMVINVRLWRDQNASQLILDYIRDNKDSIRWWDQDGINAILHDCWAEIDLCWNQIPHIFRYPSWSVSPFTEEEFLAVRTHPKAVHYSARSKPWHGDNTHPFREEFFKYLDMTVWAGWRPEKPIELISNGGFEIWDGGQPQGWKLSPGTIVRRSSESRFQGASVEISPHPERVDNHLQQMLLPEQPLVNNQLVLSMDAKCSEPGVLAFNLYLRIKGKRKAISLEHPGHGAWATIRHEFYVPAGTDPENVRCLIVLRKSAKTPVLIENVKANLFRVEEPLDRDDGTLITSVDLQRHALKARLLRLGSRVTIDSLRRTQRKSAIRRKGRMKNTIKSGKDLVISVILSNYNGSRFLREALRSVVEQDYPRFEMIVVEDASTDESPKIIREMTNQYPDLVQPIYKSENEGQAAGFNDGFKQACGDLICFIDSDDMYFPEKLTNLARLVRSHPDHALYQHNLNKIIDGRLSGEKFRDVVISGDLFGFVKELSFFPLFVPTSGLAFPRWVLEKIMPIPAEFKICADGYLTRTAFCYGPVGSINECWGAYRVHEDNSVFQNPEHDSHAYRDGLLVPILNKFYRENGIDLYFDAKPLRKSSSEGSEFPRLRLAFRARSSKRKLVSKIMDLSIRQVLYGVRRRVANRFLTKKR